MKVKFLQKDTRSAEFSFVAKYSEVPHTYDKYHYHKEYELAFQIENQGTRFVGDSIRRFTSGDLVLIAPNIPHYWHSDDMYYEDSGKSVKLVVFHFVDDCFGKDFFNIPEMSAAKSLLEKARQGIQITGDLAEEIGQEMIRIVNETGWKRISGLISILNKIGEASNINLLTSVGFSDSLHKSHNEKKITGIYNYIVENHFRNITLDEIASFAHMNSSAFCRYFKEATNKTFSKVLNEIRIGVACRELINTESDISQIGYNCGYENITYFNRQFKLIKKLTPLEYRLKYIQREKSI